MDDIRPLVIRKDDVWVRIGTANVSRNSEGTLLASVIFDDEHQYLWSGLATGLHNLSITTVGDISVMDSGMNVNEVSVDNWPRRLASKVESLGPEEIESRFGFHKATIEGDNATQPVHTELRKSYREFAEYLDQVLPSGRAKSVALTELETASMWSHKAVAEQAPLVDEND